MLLRPALRSWWELERVDDVHALLFSEHKTHLLRGAPYVALAELLHAPRPVDALLHAAVPHASAAEVFYALERLESLGALREYDDTIPPETAAFWDAAGIDAATALRAIAHTPVSIVTSGNATATLLAQALAEAGVSIENDAASRVVVTDDYLRPVRDDAPSLLVRVSGRSLWIGPLLGKGRGCWECLAHRMRAHRVVETFLSTRRGTSYVRRSAGGSLPSMERAAAAFAATEIVKCIAGVTTFASTLMTVNLASLQTERHHFVPRPHCAVCGTPRQNTPALHLKSRRKQFTGDGGHRATPPEATLARYGHHVSRICGIVGELVPLDGGEPAVAPIYSSGHNAATKDDSLDSLRGRFRRRSGGKGTTDAQARASALCEALERYSGVHDGTEPRLRATAAHLGDAAIHPNTCLGYSETQYAKRTSGMTERHTRVPRPFDSQRSIDWTPLWSLTNDETRYLPTAYCYYDAPVADEERFCWADSNGCAAGNSLEEAILQGFFELVERDAVALWWYNRIARPGVDLDSFGEPYIAALTRHYASLGRDLWALDLTSDLGIPTFAAISRRAEGAERITFGFGTHFDARLALLRALTELNQSLPVTSGELVSSGGDNGLAAWLREETVARNAYLLPADGARVRAGDPYVPREDLKDDVEACVRIAASRGLETLVLDQTRGDVGLSVVRVVVPGLRHFWPRFAPGRLYDVPVAMGWLAAPPGEEALNPTPLCF